MSDEQRKLRSDRMEKKLGQQNSCRQENRRTFPIKIIKIVLCWLYDINKEKVESTFKTK